MPSLRCVEHGIRGRPQEWVASKRAQEGQKRLRLFIHIPEFAKPAKENRASIKDIELAEVPQGSHAGVLGPLDQHVVGQDGGGEVFGARVPRA